MTEAQRQRMEQTAARLAENARSAKANDNHQHLHNVEQMAWGAAFTLQDLDEPELAARYGAIANGDV